MSESVLLRERRDRVATFTFNRPEKLNAFNEELTEALLAALDAVRDDADVRAVVLRGSGRGFSAGQDLEAFVRLNTGAAPVSVAEHLRRGYNRIVLAIRTMPKPVIASLNGISAGVGLSLALACDVRIAGDDTHLTLGFAKIGLIPDGGASYLLPLLAGFGRGLELALLSDRIDAHEAERFGLVNRVVPAERLVEETQRYAQRFAEMSPVAATMTKRAFNASTLAGLEAWLDAEADFQEEAASGPDLMEGVRSFLEKRRPAFAGR